MTDLSKMSNQDLMLAFKHSYRNYTLVLQDNNYKPEPLVLEMAKIPRELEQEIMRRLEEADYNRIKAACTVEIIRPKGVDNAKPE